MKFFNKHYSLTTFTKIKNKKFIDLLKLSNIYLTKKNKHTSLNLHIYSYFISSLFKNGFFLKYSLILSKLIYMFYLELFVTGSDYFKDLVWGVKNFLDLFTGVTELIKPPFVIQTTLVPKKLKRKIKLKYLIKIVYKNQIFREAIALRQLKNSSNLLSDATFPVRLYKSIMDVVYFRRDSNLFKKKVLVFKRFLKM